MTTKWLMRRGTRTTGGDGDKEGDGDSSDKDEEWKDAEDGIASSGGCDDHQKNV